MRQLSSMSVNSWSEAISFAISEHQRTKRTYWAVEYEERNSADGMRFYEACNLSTLRMLELQYRVINKAER